MKNLLFLLLILVGCVSCEKRLTPTKAVVGFILQTEDYFLIR